MLLADHLQEFPGQKHYGVLLAAGTVLDFLRDRKFESIERGTIPEIGVDQQE
jgi:hypothetical protein